ncbi:MAG: D-glycero-beta-D-manno-heptose 1,7-bisphosphate 7-phosphatase [Desulfobacteraceae bacterium]|nr:D-glycero-beta-D-manno-heptose 1,7-bisphosphate 7-phosphatase [Desulfobacteraceae bacterium]
MDFTIFLDRDGVINQDSKAYIKTPSEFHFIDGSPEAIALLNRHGFEVIIITNQSIINRKMASVETLSSIFDKMTEGIQKAGGQIKDIFFCPHRPDEGCTCRKPKPGLIFQALEKHRIDLALSCMVGDSAKDIECGKNAGCSKSLLVKTGNGHESLQLLTAKGITPDFVGADLYATAQWIIKNLNNK